MNRPKLGLSKSDWRLLTSRLAILEAELHRAISNIARQEHKISKTRYANLERRIRLKLNALELLKLHLETYNPTINVTLKRQKKNTGFRQTCDTVKGTITKIKAKI